MEKSIWRVALTLVMATTFCSGVSAADGLDDFVATYQCSLAGLIARIHAHRQSGDQGRFIILSLHGPTAAYVQCAFGDKDRDGLCEASSGWWNKPQEKPHIGTTELSAQAQLGFSTDGSHGNFQKQMHFPPDGPEPDVLARLMLSALYEIYGARKETRIEVTAPFALRHGFLPPQRCELIS